MLNDSDEAIVVVEADVVGDLITSPPGLFFGLLEENQLSETKSVRIYSRTGNPLTLSINTHSAEFILFDLEKQENGSYILTANLDISAANNSETPLFISGELKLESDREGEEEVLIPYFAISR